MASNYRIGIGISEVTDIAVGLQMMGFADDSQKTTGVESRLFSRAFIVEDQGAGKRVVFVSAEILSGTDAVKQEVVKQLQKEFPAVYTNDNVLISGTHTHSAPHGYSGYRLYNLTGGGFDPHTFECIVSGIVASIKDAHNNLGPGNIYVAKGVIENCGRNRSVGAYNNNPQAERDQYPADTDKEMLLLKFMRQDSGEHRPIGVLSWFAIHPTDRGQKNTRVGGDNKGFASFLFEHAMNPPFVAAFANANAGDVSGNVEYGRIPNGIDDVDHMERHARIEYRTAKQLFESASEELSGSIDYRHTYVDMENVVVTGSYPNMGQTFRGALGLSFAAGSTEDSTPNPNLGLREGITTQNITIPEKALQNIGAWAVSQFKDIPVDESVETVGGHLPKPILFGVGKGGLTPKILPLQILRIGQLVIVGVPAEITTMAGRRLRATVLGELSSIGVKHLAITAYANDYSQYITTKEEYDMQHYEGASTLFGPRTLLAYQQEFRKLAIALGNGRPVNPGPTPPGNSSPTYRRLTFRNLSTEEIQLYYYKWYESEYEFLRGKKGAGAPSEDGIITIPANGDVAIPETQLRDKPFSITREFKGTLDGKPLTIDNLVFVSKEGSLAKEYKPPALSGYEYLPGGLLEIISKRSQKGFGGYDLMDGRDQAFAFDYTGSGKLDHLFFYRPGSGTFYIVTYKQGRFLTVYKASDVKALDDGLRPWLFQRFSNLRGFALDYRSQGRLDHVAFYAPGQGLAPGYGHSIIAKRHPRDRDDYDWQSYGGPLTESCNLSDPNDKAFAFDYLGNGFLDHVVVYRPGTGKIWILGIGSDGFHWEDKWKSENGIAGFSLRDPRDLGLAFDYGVTGRLDHLVFYRPGTGIVRIIKKEGNGFRSVYESTAGIGRWDLSSPLDRIIAFDFMDDSEPGHYYHNRLVCYRPGTGRIQMIERGYGGLELTAISWSNSLVTATTRTPHEVQVGQELEIGYVRPPSYNGTFQALAGTAGNTLVYALATNPGTATFLGRGGKISFSSTFVSDTGIGTYDLKGVKDQILAFDYKDDIAGKMAATSSGPSELFLFRPGSGVAFIAQSIVQSRTVTEPAFIPAYWYSGLPEPLREPRRADLSALASAPEASGDPAGYARSDGTNSVVYRGADNHIYELYLAGGSWSYGDLTKATGAPEASGDPAGYARSDGTNSVVYRGEKNHIYEFYIYKGFSWNYGDLTKATGAPAASGDPAGYARSDGTNSVVYRGANNHIYELYLPKGGSWICAHLSEGIGAPAASGNPVGYARSDGTNSVLYRGANNHIYELYLPKGGSWICAKLSEGIFAPAASGDPAGCVRSDGINSVVYRGENNHIYELYLDGTWHYGDLTQATDAPTALGEPAVYVRSDGINSVVYRGEKNHIYELYLKKGGSWICADLSIGTAASGDPAGYARSDGRNSVVFRGEKNHIYELIL